jgi:D-alanyl-D-alanine carboxypeptidase
MNTYAYELGLKDSSFVNVHGMCKNKSTAKDMALMLSECYKIPLFSKIASTKNYTAKAKYVSDKGEVKIKELPLVNTNKLLWMNSGCIGGKTGCNSIGGESLAACYEGGIIVVVLGSTGK